MLGLAKGEGCKSQSNHITIAEILQIKKKVLRKKVTSELYEHVYYFILVVLILLTSLCSAWTANAQGEEGG